MSILVMKFGGTSVANLSRIKNLQQLDKEIKAKFAKHYRKDIELLKIFYKLCYMLYLKKSL